MTHSLPFLVLANFKNPYQGFGQAFVHRTLSQGSYFPLLDFYLPLCSRVLGPVLPESAAPGPNRDGQGDHTRVQAVPPQSRHFAIQFVAGNLAGATTGTAFNPLTTVKYYAW